MASISGNATADIDAFAQMSTKDGKEKLDKQDMEFAALLQSELAANGLKDTPAFLAEVVDDNKVTQQEADQLKDVLKGEEALTSVGMTPVKKNNPDMFSPTQTSKSFFEQQVQFTSQFGW